MKKRMRVFVKSFLCGLLPFSLLLSGLSVSAYTGNSAKTLTSGADIRVMSYNTLVDNDEANGGWNWGQPLGNRAEKAAAAIEYYKPDVIGLQENNYNWHVALQRRRSQAAEIGKTRVLRQKGLDVHHYDVQHQDLGAGGE